MSFKFSRRLALAAAVSLAMLAAQSATPPESEDDWFDEDFETLTEQVNEGELAFLAQPPDKPVHHLDNVITLSRASRANGWVRLEQCHRNIDRVPRAQIVFHRERVRNLRVTHARNIGKAWVEGPSVQLTEIEKDASLCLEADSKALAATGDGAYRVKNGPFMRRFLDGYYPMRVSTTLVLTDSGLRFAGIVPARQPGFEVEVEADSIRYDAWFEGRLLTEIALQAAE